RRARPAARPAAGALGPPASLLQRRARLPPELLRHPRGAPARGRDPPRAPRPGAAHRRARRLQRGRRPGAGLHARARLPPRPAAGAHLALLALGPGLRPHLLRARRRGRRRDGGGRGRVRPPAVHGESYWFVTTTSST